MYRKLFLLHTGLFVIIFFCMLNGSMNGDEGIWSYMGRIWVENGITPYTGALDNKPLAIIEVHALSYALFGTNFFFPRLIGGICIIFTGCLLYGINRICFNRQAGILASVTYCLTIPWMSINGAVTANSEVFMVFFSTIGFYSLFNNLSKPVPELKLSILAGAAFGIAIAFKQVAGLSLAVSFLIYWFYRRHNSMRFMAHIIMLIISVVFTFMIFQIPVLNGVASKNYMEFAWLNPKYYDTFLWRIPKFFDAFFISRIAIFYPLLLVGILSRKGISHRSYFQYLIVWLIFAFIGVNISGHYYGHQVTQLLPPLALISGQAVGLLIDRGGQNFKGLIIISVVLFLPFSTLTHNAASILSSTENLPTSLFSHIKGNSKTKALGKWLEKHTDKDDYIYIFGNGPNSTLSYSNRLSASKYINAMRYINAGSPEKVITDLEQKKPKFIIEGKDASEYPQLQLYLKENYNLNHKHDHYPVYIRK
jgi:hypothetical protein